VPYPVPQVNDRPQSPIEFQPLEFAAAARMPRRAPALPGEEFGIGALLRFKSLMNAEGQPCHLARLCDDRLYAYERIAAAQATTNEGLRRMALELFQILHRRATAALAVATHPPHA
jgi:hypothetical protein